MDSNYRHEDGSRHQELTKEARIGGCNDHQTYLLRTVLQSIKDFRMIYVGQVKKLIHTQDRRKKPDMQHKEYGRFCVDN